MPTPDIFVNVLVFALLALTYAGLGLLFGALPFVVFEWSADNDRLAFIAWLSWPVWVIAVIAAAIFDLCVWFYHVPGSAFREARPPSS